MIARNMAKAMGLLTKPIYCGIKRILPPDVGARGDVFGFFSILLTGTT